MLKFTRKQACAVALSALFSLAVFSAPLIDASEMPLASSPVAEPTQPTDPAQPTDPFVPSEPAAAVSEAPVISEAPVVSTPEPSQPSGDVSLPPVVSGEPGETVSGGIEPLPDDSSSGAEGQTSEPSSSSSEPVSSEAPVESQPQTVIPQQPQYTPPVIQNPDTDQDLIDQLASHAATANSDPEALTSQDWSELLSQAGSEASSESSSAEGAILPTDDDPGNMTVSTRSSWLLPVGIVCILLAFAGFAVFVYLQFIAPRMKASSTSAPLTGGRTDPTVEPMTDLDGSGILTVHRPGEAGEAPEKPAPAPVRPEKPTAEEEALANQETMEISTAGLQETAPQRPEMEDIFSSDEAESIVRQGGARQAQPPQAETAEAAGQTDASRVHDTPAGESSADPNAAQTSSSGAQPRPKAQATPVSPDSDKPFDWDKFFEE